MSEIISTDLFNRALIEPLNSGANKLCIVSGYATATMAIRHIEYTKLIRKPISIELIVGMSSKDGVERRNHDAFLELMSGRNGVDFKCSYVINRPPVHSKIYSWLKDDAPYAGFIGSANYTQNAFSSSMREVLSPENPEDCLEYFNAIKGEVLSCDADNIADHIEFFERVITTRVAAPPTDPAPVETAPVISTYTGLESVTLRLTDANGHVPTRSGLNWGQRPGREPNQAYINIPAEVGRSGFFPDRYVVFTVVTDEGAQLICVRAQDGGKGLHTTLNNSILGEYFRNRLGLPNGALVTVEHLLLYGRTDVTFYKIDEESYYMDFSVR